MTNYDSWLTMTHMTPDDKLTIFYDHDHNYEYDYDHDHDHYQDNYDNYYKTIMTIMTMTESMATTWDDEQNETR